MLFLLWKFSFKQLLEYLFTAKTVSHNSIMLIITLVTGIFLSGFYMCGKGKRTKMETQSSTTQRSHSWQISCQLPSHTGAQTAFEMWWIQRGRVFGRGKEAPLVLLQSIPTIWCLILKHPYFGSQMKGNAVRFLGWCLWSSWAETPSICLQWAISMQRLAVQVGQWSKKGLHFAVPWRTFPDPRGKSHCTNDWHANSPFHWSELLFLGILY